MNNLASVYDPYSLDAMSRSALGSAQVWMIIALILSLVGGILTYFLFVKAKINSKSKFVNWFKKFLDFKSMWIEVILKISYYVLTLFAVLTSFTYLSLGGDGVLLWLLNLIIVPIVIRVCYEAFMMFIMIWRNTQDIADNTKKK